MPLRRATRTPESLNDRRDVAAISAPPTCLRHFFRQRKAGHPEPMGVMVGASFAGKRKSALFQKCTFFRNPATPSLPDPAQEALPHNLRALSPGQSGVHFPDNPGIRQAPVRKEKNTEFQERENPGVSFC